MPLLEGLCKGHVLPMAIRRDNAKCHVPDGKETEGQRKQKQSSVSETKKRQQINQLADQVLKLIFRTSRLQIFTQTDHLQNLPLELTSTSSTQTDPTFFEILQLNKF